MNGILMQINLLHGEGSAGGYYALMACLCDKDKEFDNENDLNIEADASIAGAVSAWYPCTDFTTLDE